MSDFEDILTADADQFTDTFGESVVYIDAATSTERTITAIVERGAPGQVEGPSYGVANTFKVIVINDSTTGISSDEVDCGRDVIKLAHRLGKTATERTIISIAGHDPGLLTLEVR